MTEQQQQKTEGVGEQNVTTGQQQSKTEGGGEKVDNVMFSNLIEHEDLQVRVELDEEVVADYAERMADGEKFPPVVVFRDVRMGTMKDGYQFKDLDHNYLADGYHRVAAAKRNGKSSITCTYRDGTIEDAVWYAVGANKKTGLRMGKADVRRAVEVGSHRFPDKTQADLAKQVGCSQQYVSKVQQEMTDRGDLVLPDTRMGADGKARPTTYRKVEPEEAGEAVEAPVQPVDPSQGEPSQDGAGKEETKPGAAKAQGMRIADKAVSLLKTIDIHDPERTECFISVAGWIADQLLEGSSAWGAAPGANG